MLLIQENYELTVESSTLDITSSHNQPLGNFSCLKNLLFPYIKINASLVEEKAMG